jgi:hypothetical protein
MNANEPIKPDGDGIIRLVFKTFTYAPEFQYLADLDITPEAHTETWTGDTLERPNDPEPPKDRPDTERDR